MKGLNSNLVLTAEGLKRTFLYLKEYRLRVLVPQLTKLAKQEQIEHLYLNLHPYFLRGTTSKGLAEFRSRFGVTLLVEDLLRRPRFSTMIESIGDLPDDVGISE